MKYSDRQNAKHFLKAMLNQLELPGNVEQPLDCPLSRWASLNREAQRSLPSFLATVNDMVRKPYGVNKQMTFDWRQG